MLLLWRLRLRANLSMVKKAKTAQKHFLVKNFWKKWALKFADKQRQKKLQEFETRVVTQYFHGSSIWISPFFFSFPETIVDILVSEWKRRVQEQRQRKLAEETIKQRIALVRVCPFAYSWIFDRSFPAASHVTYAQPLDHSCRRHQVPRVGGQPEGGEGNACVSCFPRSRHDVDLSIFFLLSAAFAKWKALCIRHVEELSLMESYQDVKREGKPGERDALG